jgi:hypothetical protein
MLLVLVDAHSKWLDVHVVPNSTTATTIQRLRQSFATHGLPDLLVSDNGPNLVSDEMRQFLSRNGIRHVRTAPYHPASNGQAERAVQTLKSSLAKQRGGDLDERVARFLLTYRTTPHSTTGVPPCELLMGRRLRTLLDRVRPDMPTKVERQQALQKQRHDERARHRPIDEGDHVLAKDWADSGRWKPATVTGCAGSVNFECKFGDGRTAHRHADQLLKDLEPQPTGESTDPPVDNPAASSDPTATSGETIEPRRSTRPRTKPERLTYA